MNHVKQIRNETSITSKGHENPGKHESIGSLPTIKELRRSTSRLEWLGKLLRNDEARKSTREVREELDGLVSLVDDFYRLLGDRNWAFSDALNLEKMRAVIGKPTPEEAERELVEYLKEGEVLHRMITRLNRFPDMRPRMPLLKKAEQDYLQGRYCSSVLVTVTVMDRFVNDAFRSEGRKGLHARESEKLHAGDCVATVWDRLPSIQKVFTKSIHARINEPVCEVYRHGIMHGMATDYDNDVVASKAWCMLFVVGDWVDAEVRKRETEDEDPRNIVQVLKGLSDTQRRNAENDRRLENWEKQRVDLEHPAGPDEELVRGCTGFLEAWKAKSYGVLGSFFPNFANKTPGAQAGEARESYSSHPIEGYEIEEIIRPVAAVANAKIRLHTSGRSWSASIRLSRLDGTTPVDDWEPGAWRVMGYGVDPFVDAEENRLAGGAPPA